ncbi:Predicted phosphohydrolase, MPP superfamily [Lutibacter oricola]|uniref:Predicted phosphohydrolase, MPP superfamily n=1 Tax=Lutibacter oricola TaxID=762486 RepID=A0A1H3A4W7_9FLAO|nr:metallophosphoesterase family protein [Lutibacter oricola]SDX24727.1 Predicted phosphohydrolase, MPP superfamily [Lutibacter oricola]
MKKILIVFFIGVLTSYASNDKYRLMLRNNASTSVVIGWNQISGTNPIVYYGKKDHKTNFSNYSTKKSPDRIVEFRGMNNHFVRLINLSPNTAYYFVIKDSEGVSERFWFTTAPNNKDKISIISGGDSRNNRKSRQNANKLVSKLKPNIVMFGGDMTSGDTDKQWIEWMDDWQLTIAKDNRIFPLIAARGNHEKENKSIYNLFDTPHEKIYYSIPVGKNYLRIYTLNTEISIPGGQTNWLKNELLSNKKDYWKIVQYHKPMRPHVSRKREGNFQYLNWAQLFYNENIDLIVECDAHTVKSTWPIKPSTKKGSEEGFIRDNKNGNVYVGEGCWGAPIRKNDDNKSWTRDSGMFNQFKWIFVSKKSIITRTIKTDNASLVGELNNNTRFEIPKNLDIWNPPNGAIVEIKK